MAILRGFPPSNTINPRTIIPQDQHGKSVVVEIDKKTKNILLSNGLWACYSTKDFSIPLPEVGDEVFWSAGSSWRGITWYHKYPGVSEFDKPITWVDGLDTPPKFDH